MLLILATCCPTCCPVCFINFDPFSSIVLRVTLGPIPKAPKGVPIPTLSGSVAISFTFPKKLVCGCSTSALCMGSLKYSLLVKILTEGVIGVMIFVSILSVVGESP